MPYARVLGVCRRRVREPLNRAAKDANDPAIPDTFVTLTGMNDFGALINQAIHGIDLLQWFAGLPSEVFSWNTRRVHTGIVPLIGAVLLFANLRLVGVDVGTQSLLRRLRRLGNHGFLRLAARAFSRDFCSRRDSSSAQ